VQSLTIQIALNSGAELFWRQHPWQPQQRPGQ
jgi:hypothetical protein